MSLPSSYARLHDDATELLRRLEPWDGHQRELCDWMLEHLDAHPDAMRREGPPDHFTASAFVFDPSGRRVLLVLHGKALIWCQPGGHFESGDTDIVAAALREALEETGVTADPVADLIQLDHHQLPSAFGRCTSHLDLRVIAIARDEELTLSHESRDVQWWPIDELPDPIDPRLPDVIHQARERARIAGAFAD